MSETFFLACLWRSATPNTGAQPSYLAHWQGDRNQRWKSIAAQAGSQVWAQAVCDLPIRSRRACYLCANSIVIRLPISLGAISTLLMSPSVSATLRITS